MQLHLQSTQDAFLKAETGDEKYVLNWFTKAHKIHYYSKNFRKVDKL